MGQKVKPIGMRVGINRTWDSRWYAGKNYADLLHQDRELRAYIMRTLRQAAISRVVIERPAGHARVTIYAGRPGLIIGKKGADIEALRIELTRRVGSEVNLNIVEIRKPEIDAKLVAESIAQQLERRVAFRRAMKRSVQSAMRLGALGVRVNCAGRLGGAEIARTEWYREGRVPLHTLRAEVDYGEATAHTTYGACGVKVWVFKGEVLGHDPMAQDRRMKEIQPPAPARRPTAQTTVPQAPAPHAPAPMVSSTPSPLPPMPMPPAPPAPMDSGDSGMADPAAAGAPADEGGV